MKFLVIRFSSLGDVVLSTAIFPNIKAKFPESEVSVLTRAPFAPVFDDNPHVDHVYIFDPQRQPFAQLVQEIREKKFDVIIDLQGNFRSWYLRMMAGSRRVVVVEKLTWPRHRLVWFKRASASLKKSVRERILDCLAPLEIPIVNTETKLFSAKESAIPAMFALTPEMRLVGIAPGAKHNTKKWNPERFAEAADRLGAVPNSMVVLVGDKSDKAAAEAVSKRVHVPCQNAAGWTSLRELISLVSRMTLLLTNDSGVMHIAEALKIPVVAVFGPTVRPFGFAPYRQTSRVVEVVNLHCRPCTLHGSERCPLGHHKCMEDVDVNAVLYAASSLFGES